MTFSTRLRARFKKASDDTGTSLVEVAVSMVILATLAAGLFSMAALALTRSENQGHLAARTAEYAQDKMEQLLVLAFNDSTTDTRVFPATPSNGTGLTQGGDDLSNVAGYVDWLDADGNLLASNSATAPANWFYVRRWKVTSISGTLKEVRVTATVARSIGRMQLPVATLVTLKSFPF